MTSSTTFTYNNTSSIPANAILTTPGLGSISWANTCGSSSYTVAADTNIKGASLLVKGDAEFEGDVTLKGKSLKDSLDKIEEKLAILHPNEELEEKWENLRGLRKMYMELEAEIKDKEKMWAILKR